jgi:shikimate kinase
MDIARPSNITRIAALFSKNEKLRARVLVDFCACSETIQSIERVYKEFGYRACPHTAVGFACLERQIKKLNLETIDYCGIVISTADAVKFVGAHPIYETLKNRGGGLLKRPTLSIHNSVQRVEKVIAYLSRKRMLMLIGMPSCGKTTLGRQMSVKCLDIDTIMGRVHGGVSLFKIKSKLGDEDFMAFEEHVALSQLMLRDIDRSRFIMSPGGSIIYCNRVMEHACKRDDLLIVYLEWDKETIFQRTERFTNRAVVFPPNMDINSFYESRHTLYSKFADVTIHCEGHNEGALLDLLGSLINSPDEATQNVS